MWQRDHFLLLYLECEDGRTVKMTLNHTRVGSQERDIEVKIFKDSHLAAEYIEENILKGMRYGRPGKAK